MRRWADVVRDAYRSDPRRFLLRAGAGLVLLSGLIFLWQASTAVRALDNARASAAGLANAIAEGDVNRARVELAAFNSDTTRAHKRTDGPLWWLGGKIPLIGANIRAVSIVAAQADVISDDALPQVVRVADQIKLETFRPRNGRIDLAAVSKTRNLLAHTDRVVARADQKVGGIKVDDLVSPLQGPVAEFKSRVDGAAAAIGAAHQAAELLPAMLGGDGPTRRYLLVVATNSEIRSLGGMPGSFAVLTTRRGALKMDEQGGTRDLKALAEPVAHVEPELRAGFGSRIATDVRETATIPDFPRAADLLSRIAAKRWPGRPFDGVVSVDPVSLGYVLGAVGKIDIGNGLTIDGSNAASTLLNGIYLKFPDQPAAQDDAFKHAARRTFNALISGRGNSVGAIRALVRGVQEHRIMLWSRHPAEQQRIRRSGLAGLFTDQSQPRRPQVGVYVTDSTQGKMEYYLRMGTRVHPTACYAGDIQDIQVTTTLRSEAPQGGRPLPKLVTGFGKIVPIGQIGVNTRIVSPPRGRILSLVVDGKPAPLGDDKYRGRQIVQVNRHVPPGESTVIVARIRTAQSMSGDPLLRSTPGVQPNDDAVDPSACG